MDESLPSLAKIIENPARAQRELLRAPSLRNSSGKPERISVVQFIAAHEKRQMKPMQEIAETLPKTVTSLHK
jgi:hypothetical protein